MIRKLVSIGLVLVLGQVVVAQEYDDVYFTAKDRKTTVFVKNTNSIFSPNNSNGNQQADDPLSGNSGNLQNKFANPEYNGQASNNAVNMPYYRKEVNNDVYFNSLYTNPYSMSLYDNFNNFGNANRYSFWADPMMARYYGFNNFGCPTSAFSMGWGTGFNSFNSWNWGMNSGWGGMNSFWGMNNAWGGMNSFWGMNSWNSWNNWNRWNTPNVIVRNDNWQRRGVYQGTRSNRSSDFSINQNQRTGRTGGRTEGWNYNSGNTNTRESRSNSNSRTYDRSSGYENRNSGSTWGNSGGRSDSGSSWGSGSSGGGRSSGSSSGGGRSGGSSGGGGGGRSGRGN